MAAATLYRSAGIEKHSCREEKAINDIQGTYRDHHSNPSCDFVFFFPGKASSPAGFTHGWEDSGLGRKLVAHI